MKTILGVSLVAIGLGMAAGCVKVDAKAPSFGESPPPASVVSAEDGDKADLLRENQQLRDRIAWLEKENHKLVKKSRDLDEDMQDILEDMEDIAAERDRYKRAVER